MMKTDVQQFPELSYSFAKRHGVLLRYQAEQPVLHWKVQINLTVLQEIQRLCGQVVHTHTCIPVTDFERILAEFYEQQQHSSAKMIDHIHDELDLSDISKHLHQQPEDLLDSSDDAPIIRLINALLTEAIKDNASDIHIDAFEQDLLVRFRIDGILQTVVKPPNTISALLVSRIKVMAKLDIAEKRLPQDGRISLRIAGRAVDVRVSTLPSGHGERVVMRLLDKRDGLLSLEELGLTEAVRCQFQSAIQKPHGVMLVTGPTGSGKTTTLYSALALLNDRRRNIMTIEDPIEYYLDGISQTQVNTKVDMSFARGLRAILRQDPDVVMVGEIRDYETAEIVVQSSLTGHLVFSTLHTNSALGAITRLRDMGVEPFLLASSLLGVLAQRLVRKLCLVCREADTLTDSEQQRLQVTYPAQIYRAKGCEHCNHMGYRGRIGIYELIMIDKVLQTMIHDNRSEAAMAEYAHQHHDSIFIDGRRLILAGLTTIEEVLQVTLEHV